jgi:hypothetical protein
LTASQKAHLSRCVSSCAIAVPHPVQNKVHAESGAFVKSQAALVYAFTAVTTFQIESFLMAAALHWAAWTDARSNLHSGFGVRFSLSFYFSVSFGDG